MTAIDAPGRAAGALRPYLGERVLVPDDDGFPTARRGWNAAVTATPAGSARRRGAGEGRRGVHAARDAGLPLSVRAGGHDWAGRALREGGLVIDLTGMRTATVDAAGRTVTVAGGATAGDLVAA